MSIIGLSGYKRSGKSSVAKILVEEYGFMQLSLAEPLKKMLVSLYHSAGITDSNLIWDKLEGDLKEVYCEILGTTPRYAMQTLGTEWRMLFNEHLWIDILINKIKKYDYPNIVISDVRFPVEVALLSKEFDNFKLWNIARPGYGGTSHSSEQDISVLSNSIISNDSTLEELKNKVRIELYDIH